MASSCDDGIVEEVNRTSQRLSGLSPSLNDPDGQLDDISLDSNGTFEETKEFYRTRIEKLQEEVNLLRDIVVVDERRLLQIGMDTLVRIRTSLKLGKGSGINSVTQDHLDMQYAYTGIRYSDATVRVLKQDATGTVRLHRLKGQCSGLDFQVEYRVQETTLTESDKLQLPSSCSQETRSRITTLSAVIDDRTSWEIQDFIRSVEKECGLQIFLRGYGQYAQLADGRRRTFEHFKKRYPDLVALPLGPFSSIMKFGSEADCGALYTITWAITVSATGRAHQQLDIQVISSKPLRRLDEQKIIQSIPQKFQQMLERVGIERTIDTFMRSVEG